MCRSSSRIRRISKVASPQKYRRKGITTSRRQEPLREEALCFTALAFSDRNGPSWCTFTILEIGHQRNPQLFQQQQAIRPYRVKRGVYLDTSFPCCLGPAHADQTFVPSIIKSPNLFLLVLLSNNACQQKMTRFLRRCNAEEPRRNPLVRLTFFHLPHLFKLSPKGACMRCML